MDNLRKWGIKLKRPWLLLAVGLIVLGLILTTYFGIRAVRSFQQLRYIHEQGLDRGTARVEAIRPWMTIRFVAVAYAVPEEYLYSQLEIPFERRNADRAMGELNRDYKLGNSPKNNELVIIEKMQAAIKSYQENPVVTGLRDVRPWMSVRYIANSTGVPEDYIFEQLGLPSAGNKDKPLDLLDSELRYPGGLRVLIENLQRVLDQYQEAP